MRRPAVVAVAACALVGACAGIPSSGPVEKITDDRGLEQSTVRYAPVGPSRGASPQQIVRGYLDSMLAYPVSTGTAASYLSPDAAQVWKSSAGVTVYAEPEVTLPGRPRPLPGRTGVDVVLRTDEDARLDRQGHYSRSTGERSRTYRLEQVNGEWRITNPQDGVMVTRTYYDSYFRPFPLYFFDASGERLVSDLVHLAVGEQLPTALMTSLARGPSQTPGTLRTYVPSVGSLRPSVTVGAADVADVEFSTSLTRLSVAERDRLAAQIVWTLRSVSSLQGVRIFGGNVVLAGGGNRVQAIEAWTRFGPPKRSEDAYALVDDTLVEIDDATVQPVSGRWGRDAGGAVAAAVSDDAVAAVLSGRDEVRITDRAGRKPSSVEGTDVIAALWDLDERLWLLDRPGSSTRVRVVEDRRERGVESEALDGLDVDSFALSPDGGRFAASASDGGTTSVYVGSVRRDPDDRIIGLGEARRLDIGVDDPHSVTWVSSTRVGFLGASETGVQLHEVGLDGTDRTGGATGGGPLLPDVGATTLAGGTSEDAARWVVDAMGRLWHLPADGSWRLADERRFSGLSTGS